MKKEIELKFLNINKKELIAKLAELNAKKLYSKDFYAIYFSSGCLKNTEVLRLRKEGSKAVLCYKKKIRSRATKSCLEHEVEVSSFTKARKMLAMLGFKEILEIKKQRQSFQLGNVKVEIDKLLGKHSKVPCYLELEADNKKSLYNAIKLLGLKKEDAKPINGYDVIRLYGL